MRPLCSALVGQIRYLLTTANESNSDVVFQELCECAGSGAEGRILLLKTCWEHLGIHGEDLKHMKLGPLFGSIFRYLLDKPNFSTVLCESLKSSAISEDILEDLSNALNLSATEKIGVGLALSDSEVSELRMCGNNFCLAQIEELSASNGGINSIDKVQNILMFLRQSEGLSKHVDSFLQMLSLMQLEDSDQLLVSPFLSDHTRTSDLFAEDIDSDFVTVLAQTEKELSMADIMKELGYGCTDNVSHCKELLSLLQPLTETTVSKILGMIARTHVGLENNQNAFPTFYSATGGSNLSDMPLSSSWNIDVLVESIKQLAPGINWITVVENLDHEGFFIPNEASFSLFMSVYKRACQDPFPLHAVCGSIWKNTEGQLSFLKYAVSVPPEVFTFAHSRKQLAYVDAVHGHKLQLGHANHAWLCLDLIDVLCQLAERGHASTIRSILKQPLEGCSEVLLLGMAYVNTAYNLLQCEVSSNVFPVMLRSSTSSGIILHLWHVNPNLLLRGFLDAHNADPDTIVRVLDTCQELEILTTVLDMVPSYFAIRLAALASRKELVDLENWLTSNLSTYKDTFFQESLKFLREIHNGISKEGPGEQFNHSASLWNLYAETSSCVLKVLQANIGLIGSGKNSEEMEKLQSAFMHNNSRITSSGVTESSPSDGYADDIETEANSYFHQMFSGQLTIDVMIQMLSRFKESSDKREQSIFECMIGNLFEEYKFFPKYPERQLVLAAILFGSLIKHQLVTHLTLGIALRGVLDALRKPSDSKMFIFGTGALQHFVDRLSEWPQYCNHILQISHLRHSHPDIVAYIEDELARISSGHSELDGGHNSSADQQHISIQTTATNMEMSGSSFPLIGSVSSTQLGSQTSSMQLQPRHQGRLDDSQKASVTSSGYSKPISSPAAHTSPFPVTDTPGTQKLQSAGSSSTVLSSSTGFARTSRSVTSARFGSALNIETLVAAAERRDTPLEVPGSEIQDKTSFLVNNLSSTNIDAKAKEFGEILKDQYYPWFAQYMVMKRASIEPNFHDLYLKFLDKVNSKPLTREIVQASYENCKVLLGSELIKSSSEERSLLKNLGSWLGKITIGRNQVLRAREIDPKSLIIEAYEKGLMIAVIPFTSKILEPCQNSVAYQPPNPWTMGILGLLAEIYAMPNLKMNLKFDIEVLFKNLSVDLKDVTPTSLLKDRVRQVDGNPDFSNKDVGASQPQMINEVKPPSISTLNQVDLPLEVAPPSHPGGHSHMLSQYAAPLHLSSGALTEDEKLAALGLSDQISPAQGHLQRQAQFSVPSSASNIEQQVIVNPKLQALGLHMHFQSVVPHAMDRAIKEIVSGIVQRSVSIATQTTKELVLKDYAMEVDDTRIRNAAHLMVASLAGSLAHVTCKEPLRASISSILRNSLQGTGIANEYLEQAVQLVTNDNLDLGCALIEQAATEKAIQTIDGEIGNQLQIRRKHREAVGPAYFDSGLYAQGHVGVLPESLRPKPGHLSHSQQRVYEDFIRLSWQNQPSHGSNALQVGPAAATVSSGISRTFSSASGQVSPGTYSGVGNTGLNSAIQPMNLVSEEMESTPVQLLHSPPAHIGTTNRINQHDFANDSIVASFPATSASELHSVETANVEEESAASSDLLPTSSATERIGNSTAEPLLTTGEALDIISEKLEALVADDAKEAETQGIINEVPATILRCISRDEAALAVAQRVFKHLYKYASNGVHVAAHLAVLSAVRDVSKLVVKELTSWVLYSEEDRKFNKDITIGLIRSELLNLAEYNVYMAKLLDAGRNKPATEFAIGLIHALVGNDNTVISELQNLVDALGKLAARPGSPESLQQLIDIARNPSANSAALSSLNIEKEDTTKQAKEKTVPGYPQTREEYNIEESAETDPPGFQAEVVALFKEWYRIYELPANDVPCSTFVQQLQQNGLLKGDDMTDRFFRYLTEFSVMHCLRSIQQGQSVPFLSIDMYAKLVFWILKLWPVEQGTGKLTLLPKVLTVTAKLVHKDAVENKSSFNPRPYFRLFINWLLDLTSMDPVFDGANFQVLTAFASAFHVMQPLKVPGFSFAWLELVSHRSFMPKLLTGNAQKGWPHMQRLLVDLLQFLEPFLRGAELGEPVQFLYRGTLRVLLVLLHDFPEFLCDYHFSFCDVIPPSCIQMRNIILSAFPRNMRLPDPSTPNLKIDLLAEISQSPRILSEVDAALKLKQIKGEVDEFLKTKPQGSPFLLDLKQKLLLPPNEAARAGTRYNVPLINSLVLYVGMQAIQQLQARSTHIQSVGGSVPLAVHLVSSALDIFQLLIVDLDTEGRYLFLNAIANQLRYPNNHTHYFSFILLFLFAESNQEIIQEQITRVLLERLIVNRPHPWGLLITFIELIKNPRYDFWNRPFTKCAPEIEKLFESVSRSCGGPKPVDNSVVSGGISENMH